MAGFGYNYMMKSINNNNGGGGGRNGHTTDVNDVKTYAVKAADAAVHRYLNTHNGGGHNGSGVSNDEHQDLFEKIRREKNEYSNSPPLMYGGSGRSYSSAAVAQPAAYYGGGAERRYGGAWGAAPPPPPQRDFYGNLDGRDAARSYGGVAFKNYIPSVSR